MIDEKPTEDFRAGYEEGRLDAIACCLMERASKTVPGWREHNVALDLAVVAIRALDVRHAPPAKDEIDA